TIFLNHPFPFNPTVTTAIYTLSLHDALPIYLSVTSDLASKQFKITVLPLDRSFEKKLQAADPDHLTDVIPTFPMSAAPQTLDDEIGRAHVLTPVTVRSRMPSSA